MKTKCFILLALFVGQLCAEEIPIAWKLHPKSQGVTNYCIWKAVGAKDFERFMNVGTNTSVVITNNEPGIVQFRLTAQGRNGESIQSDTVLQVAQPPSRPILIETNTIPEKP